MPIRWLADIDADDVSSVGGKGASLGELEGAGLPVPPAFVLTADTFRDFLDDADLEDELAAALEVDVQDSAALADAAQHAQSLVLETPLPESLQAEILAAYDDLGDGAARVAVRSSATAEDLPEASFAGQQETFLNVTREDLLDRVRECWASLYTQRAIYYRAEQGFDQAAVDIAVVVQEMAEASISGVLFTSHPSTGDDRTIVEAAWGLGEAVVSGAVSPDNYVIGPDGEVEEVAVAEKKVMHVRDEETGETVERPVPEERRTERVLADEALAQLATVGERIEAHYGTPQDVEWAIADGDLYVLQSRPITTIEPQGATEGPPDAVDVTGGLGGEETAAGAVSSETGNVTGAGSSDSGRGTGDRTPTPVEGGSDGVDATSPSGETGQTDRAADGVTDGGDAAASAGEGAVETGEQLVSGLGASPGRAGGPVSIVRKLDELDKVTDGDVLVTEMTTPDMVPAMKRATAIVTDEGGMTSHASIVSRELGVPAVVGTGNATTVLSDGQPVLVDGERGAVAAGGDEASVEAADPEPIESVRPQSPVKPMTATKVLVNVSIPEAAERAAATGADGVGLLRIEHMILSMGRTPSTVIAQDGADALVGELVDGIRAVADEFYPRPVRVRTLDAPTDEFRELEGGDDEPHEHNPMLGYRGIRRSLDQPDVFAHELAAFARLYEMGYDNVEIMFPLVNDLADVRGAKRALEDAGIDPEHRRWGVMIETPASAICVGEMAQTGMDFASFGTNDLTQYTLAVDRNNERVADRFDELHPAVLELIRDVIATCREHDVETSICGQAGSHPEMVAELVEAGITSISANIDAVRDVQHEVKRVEQRLVLDAIR